MAEHKQSAARVQAPRQPQKDDECAWCWFEGRTTQTFAYFHPGRFGLWHWCAWHQSEVPPCTGTKLKDRIPPGAQSVEWKGDWHV